MYKFWCVVEILNTYAVITKYEIQRNTFKEHFILKGLQWHHISYTVK